MNVLLVNPEYNGKSEIVGVASMMGLVAK